MLLAAGACPLHPLLLSDALGGGGLRLSALRGSAGRGLRDSDVRGWETEEEPQHRGERLQPPPLLLRWRLLERRVKQSRVGLPPRVSDLGVPRSGCPTLWDRSPCTLAEDAHQGGWKPGLEVHRSSQSTLEAEKCTFSFFQALSLIHLSYGTVRRGGYL